MFQSVPIILNRITGKILAGGVPRRLHDSWIDYQYLRRDRKHNEQSRALFEYQRPQLNDVQQRVLKDLNESGIAFAKFGELVEDIECWNNLNREMMDFIKSDKVQTRIDSYQKEFDKAFSKEYLVRQYEVSDCPTISINDPWVRVALDESLLNIVNSYLGLWSQLHYVDMWYTIPVNHERTFVGSQRWHRDPEDNRLIKVFLYFSEVDDVAGPLHYVRGSCRSTGAYHNLWRWRSKFVSYPPQEELEKTIKEHDRIICRGTAGTLVFCDTSGFHRGGYATQQSRALATWTYTSPASLSPRRFDIDWTNKLYNLSDAGEFALS
jgi:hypothetical protein